MPKIEPVSGVKQHTVYKVDGQRVPGTTTIISVLNKPFLLSWANKIGLEGVEMSRYVDKLARVGSLAHYMVEMHIKQEHPDFNSYSPEEIGLAENSFISFLEWEHGKEITYLDSEMKLVSKQFCFGGTVDAYAEINGKKTLLDFKTGKNLYPENLIQLAAYRHLAIENGFPVDEVRVLRIGRDSSEGFEERKEADLFVHWELFKLLRQVYELNKKINRKGA